MEAIPTKVKLLLTENGEKLDGKILQTTDTSYLIEWPGNPPMWVLKDKAKLADNGYPFRILEVLNESKQLLFD